MFIWVTAIKTFSDDTQGLGADTHPTRPPTHLHTIIHSWCKTVCRAQFGKLLCLNSVMMLLSFKNERPSAPAQLELLWPRSPKSSMPVIFPVAVYFFLRWGAVGPVQGQRAGVSKHSPRAHKYEGRENRKVCIPPLAICPTSFLPSVALPQLHSILFPLVL